MRKDTPSVRPWSTLWSRPSSSFLVPFPTLPLTWDCGPFHLLMVNYLRFSSTSPSDNSLCLSSKTTLLWSWFLLS
jgi:hypothetical protein